MGESNAVWAERLRAVTDPLPGLEPYLNTLRVGVAQRYQALSLSVFLAQRHPGQAMGDFELAAREGRLRVDGKAVASLEGRVAAGQIVSLTYLESGEPPVATDIIALYEDQDLLAVAKPAPLPVHPSGRYNRHTLIAFLHAMFDGQRFRPVHRLDADTTGALVLAKTAAAARHLSEQFRERRVEKTYLARVTGVPGWDAMELVHAIGKRRLEQGTRSVEGLGRGDSNDPVQHMSRPDAESQLARCLASVVRRDEQHSLLELRPETGRTHQLRLQLAACGFPIVGDAAYGVAAEHANAFSGHPLQLHALRLRIRHPSSGEALVFEAPTPDWAGSMP